MTKRFTFLFVLAFLAGRAFAVAPESAEYWLARWEQVTEDGMTFWKAPAGTIGLVDLRPLANQDNWGFFATTGTLGGDALYLGTDINGAMLDKTTWESRLGMAAGSIAATSIVDVLAETLTEDADSTGTTRALPLMPTHAGQLEIHLGGHSLVWRRSFAGASDPSWPKIKAVLWISYRKIRVEAERVIAPINGITTQDLQKRGDPNNAERDRLIKIALALKTPNRTWAQVKEIMIEAVKSRARKFLGAMVKKYRVDWRELCPADLRDWGAEEPTTTITDDFTRADSASLGSDWTEISGSYSVSSNQAVADGTGTSGAYVKHNTSLSSDDHYAQLTRGAYSEDTDYCAGVVRNSDFTGYLAVFREAYSNLYKQSGDGLYTSLIALTSLSRGSSATVGTRADGSTISAWLNGVQDKQVTDTSYSGALITGIQERISGLACDNFQAADLVAASYFPALYYHRMMGAN